MQRRAFMNVAAGAAGALAFAPFELAGKEQQKSPVEYPDPAVEVVDPRFAKYKVNNAAVERLYTGARWAEGPVWIGEGHYLLFSDIPNNRMLRWLEETGEVSVFRSPSNYSNGNFRDREGRLLTCEHDTRRVTRTEHDGNITVLAEGYQGKKFNAPNDLVVHSDGAIWFTDPGYGIMSDYEGDRADAELPTRVYRIDPEDKSLENVIDTLARPNGLCFSPGEQLLYVVDSGSRPSTIHVFDMESGRPVNGRVFADMSPGTSDGIRCDVDGNLWAAAAGGGDGYDGVHVFDPDGTVIGQIVLPEQCANLCFGGRRNNRLFMAAGQSVYSLYTNATGL